MTKPNHALLNIQEHSLLGQCSCSCLYSMRWQISCYMDQSEDRGCSVALHNSQLIYFALSFIYLLAPAHLWQCWLRSDTETPRHLVEYNGLTVEAHVTCDRVMSGSVTVIGHSPTVTIHNSVTDTPLSVSHAYCFHLIRYYNHHPFPMSPGSSSLPGILHVSDTPCHEWYWPLIGPEWSHDLDTGLWLVDTPCHDSGQSGMG